MRAVLLSVVMFALSGCGFFSQKTTPNSESRTAALAAMSATASSSEFLTACEKVVTSDSSKGATWLALDVFSKYMLSEVSDNMSSRVGISVSQFHVIERKTVFGMFLDKAVELHRECAGTVTIPTTTTTSPSTAISPNT